MFSASTKGSRVYKMSGLLSNYVTSDPKQQKQHVARSYARLFNFAPSLFQLNIKKDCK